ncbi:hypothetical protein [Streptomyces sp. NPDC051286]|uniref:DinB/UmuC family translesion DNA polymerase n=1 Tax=Streptomyces sp. NPDC051286 TaxID=3365647 RepID=UPI0037A0B731
MGFRKISRLRNERSVAQAITLTVTHADRTRTTRTRTVTEPTALTPDLGTTGHELLGLQRARDRTIPLSAPNG